MILEPAKMTSVSKNRASLHYRLSCTKCGAIFEDDGFILTCELCGNASLLVTRYANTQFTVEATNEGVFRYRPWLPVRRSLHGAGSSVTYRSESLSRITGLTNLWIAFCGYWPEKNARLLSGSFKELEALCVLGRLPPTEAVLVVASAGNTAAAFARLSSEYGVRCLIVVPQHGLESIYLPNGPRSDVRTIAITGSGDYSDAIRLAHLVAQEPGFFAEGGVRNVARRDGLGSVLLNAYETIGTMPHYYFQAVGSGTGAIAVHETARRLSLGDVSIPHLWLSQNLPFAPIYTAWRSRSRAWRHLDDKEAKEQIRNTYAQVLTNRYPPYELLGGLFDALSESDGTVLTVSNDEVLVAATIFERSEGVDISPAAAVAFASLLNSVVQELIPRDAIVLLNITGGGHRRYLSETATQSVQPDISACPEDISYGLASEIARLFF